jgi:hypothetical protein
LRDRGQAVDQLPLVGERTAGHAPGQGVQHARADQPDEEQREDDEDADLRGRANCRIASKAATKAARAT